MSLLLDERGVDFGDRFSRDAVDAFAFADDLQCMAYSVSPMVIYYNDRPRRLRADGASRPRRARRCDTDGNRERWTLAEFAAAAEFASRRGDVRRGVDRPHAAPGWRRSSTPAAARSSTTTTSRPRWPSPTTRTREALSETLAILRDPTVTPTNAQLARATAAPALQAGRAGDGRGLPQRRPRAPRAPRTSTSTSSRCRPWRAPPPSATSAACASPPTPRSRATQPTSSPTPSPTRPSRR